jgi:DNA polymerase III subunit gamma/tau
MSENHLVLARKYRPQKFQDVIHQDVPIGALKNAIKQNRVGHAYIFFGPRGVGKTTIARILAKRLNCESPIESEPCNQCNSCLEITKGNSNDVVEIDAASNRGIDDIRELRENVKFNAMGGKFKLYIIDEVHMLSLPAFNALLKTLEEPPPHIVFVLATTDLHKVPETILSRCQDFVFKKVPLSVLESYVEKLCLIENLKYDPEGIFWIAKRGDGSVRDTLSFMEQAVTFTDGNLTGASIGKMVGYQGVEPHISLLDTITKEDKPNSMIQYLENLFLEGAELTKFIWDFLDFVHTSIQLRENTIDKDNLNYPKEDIQKILNAVNTLPDELLLLISERVYSMYEKLVTIKLRNSYEIKIFLEIHFRKLMDEITKPTLSGVLQQLRELNEAIKKDINNLPNTEHSKSMEIEKKNPSIEVENTILDTFAGVEVQSTLEID